MCVCWAKWNPGSILYGEDEFKEPEIKLALFCNFGGNIIGN